MFIKKDWSCIIIQITNKKIHFFFNYNSYKNKVRIKKNLIRIKKVLKFQELLMLC